MLIRSALPRDAAAIAELLRQLGYPDNAEDDVRARITGWQAEPHAFALVAEVDGAVGGVLALATVRARTAVSPRPRP